MDLKKSFYLPTPIKRGLGQFASIAAPKLLNGAATLGMNFLLLRFMGASDLGLLSICIASILLSDAVFGSALDMAILRIATDGDAGQGRTSRQAQASGLFLKLTACFCALLVLLVWSPLVWRLLTGLSAGADLLYSAWLATVGMLVLRSAQVGFQIDRKFATYGLFDVAHSVLRFGAIGYLMATRQVSARSILWCFALAPWPVIGAWLLSAGHRLFSTLALSRGSLRELISFARWFLLTFALSSLISRLDIFLLPRLGGLNETGILAAGQMFALIPQMLGLYLSVVVGPRIMPLIARNDFWSFFRSTQSAILIGTLVTYIAFEVVWSIFGASIIPTKYLRSAGIIQILMPGALAGMATFPLTLGFVMFVRPRFLFAIDCISLPVLLLLYFVGINAAGAAGAAMVTSGANIFRASLTQWMAWKWARKYAPDRKLGGIDSSPAQVLAS